MAVGTPYKKKLYFNGNSIMASDANHTMTGVRYIPYTIYSNLLALGHNLAVFDYSKGSQKQSEINAIMANQINSKTCGANDIVVLWEITNDLGINQTVTAAQAFTNIQTYINYVSQFTQKYIICTCAARDFSGDLVTLMPKIDDVNNLIRANYNTNNICDIAANTNFDTKAKASISPPYSTDKLHLIQSGKDIVIGLMQSKIEYFLNN